MNFSALTNCGFAVSILISAKTFLVLFSAVAETFLETGFLAGAFFFAGDFFDAVFLTGAFLFDFDDMQKTLVQRKSPKCNPHFVRSTIQ